MNIKFKPLAISILIALGVGGLSGFLTMGNMDIYGNINKPPLSPPPIVFPIVWTILFILMGISAYLIYESNSNLKGKALAIYGLQLVVNFFWPIIFFNGQKFLLAFVWLLLLVALIIETILIFKDINKKASLLLIPYLLWSIFATYLNLGVYLLNR
ncbi:MAG: tryptophan-rich sensory protein [Tyzzerella sp.]|uniref:Tryptophan-rich sensory protein n=1 Tax=Candidatus Fimicola merdigallinarum TaxID=2840819 RepID=A0A9D9H3S6_9FIRM|nr:tryptophan-rich sensory protein [Candidatus Fimicola merdigallinarum]